MTKPHKIIHVATAVIENKNKILIAKRPEHLHQGGLWEFPGGKVETGESVIQALQRELLEEVNIDISCYEPLIQIEHDYPDKSVFLDVWKVTTFNGEPRGMEGQEILWIDKHQLHDYQFPAANLPIINAALLPAHYMITPEPDPNRLDEFLTRFTTAIDKNISLVQLRAKQLSFDKLEWLVEKLKTFTECRNITLYVNCDLDTARKLQLSHIHLSSKELQQLSEKPENLVIAASCHNLQEIEKATSLGANFIVLSCVKATRSHPDSVPLGWQKFRELTLKSKVPCYALGGMQMTDLTTARNNGAQGIAGISTFWPL